MTTIRLYGLILASGQTWARRGDYSNPMVRVAVANLKQELEQLFPGKWLSAGESARTLKTGIEQIDLTLSAGLVRRQDHRVGWWCIIWQNYCTSHDLC